MALKNVHAFGGTFDLSVARADAGRLRVELAPAGATPVVQTIAAGETLSLGL
jgi:hypothetical protein